MLTAFDKALAAILVPLVVWLNQKYGLHLNADPEVLGSVVAAATAIIVYFVPNKEPQP